MKKNIGIVIAVIVFALGSSASAADKIGFVDIKDVFFQSEAGKKEMGDVQKEIEKKKTIIQEKEKELRTLKSELDKQRLVLTKEAYGKKELDYQAEVKEYKRLVEDSNDELAREEQEIKKKLIPDIVKIAKEIGKKEGYAIILDISSGQYTGVLLYYSEANDLTTKVIKEYNKLHNAKK